jgi:membrane protease YdiL (CAAX protease family)
VEALAPQAPPDPPEETDPVPRWPAWYGGAAFLVALCATFVVIGVIAAATGTVSSDDQTATFSIVATLVQDSLFAATAVVFASFTLKPRAWHFGLRSTRLWPAVGWAALALVAFYVFTALYSVAVHPDAEQNITKELGADQGTLGLVAAGFIVIAVAPAAEEFFFRGVFYRALTTRFPIVTAAAIDGLVFGAIHYDFSGANALLILPPLAILGFVFCLVYERTGTIFPTIGLHAFNNSIAYGVSVDNAAVSLVLGPLMLIGCLAGPRLLHRRIA